MSNIDNQDRIPLEKSRPLAPPLHRPTFPHTWITIIAMTAQVVLCGLAWAFAGVIFVKQSIPLPYHVASLVYYNQSEKMTIVTWTSMVLATVTGSLQVLFGYWAPPSDMHS
ncbi:hypothetical protein V8E55_010650 [Tylopilus felleus]